MSEVPGFDQLTEFVAQARWFGGKGRGFTVSAVRRAGVLPHGADDPRVAIDLVTVSYTDGTEGSDGSDSATELYQVPLVFAARPIDRLAHALVGIWSDAEFGDSHVYDAVHDREAMSLWLRAFAAAEDPAAAASGSLLFHRLPGHELDLDVHSTLFSGEQSNSSVAFGDDSLMKVFRKVTPGVNPDIAIHEVLTEAGSDNIASLYGWLDVVDDDSDSVIQLAMLQQFLRTGTDGWDLAQVSVRNLFAEADLHAEEVGGDFAAESERLGVALHDVHSTLAEHFPVEQRNPADMAGLAERMQERLDEAVGIVPGLSAYADGLARIFAGVGALSGDRAQRIHADLHLGQTMRTVKGWKIVDFEGEPAKSLAERMLPDSVWRDVAGMLRSYDYAPAAASMLYGDAEGDEATQRSYRATEWTQRNRNAFVTAYAGRELTPDELLLLRAYEADKAVYECLYETRNRPAWIEIPLSAVRRLVA